MSNVYTNASQIAADIEARVKAITKANGYETDIGTTVFRGKIAVNDEDVPCTSIIEGLDTVQDTPGRITRWSIDQAYALVGYEHCDPAAPNDTAHAIIRDLKRAMFITNGQPDATLGGKVRKVSYKGRNIAPRADGQSIVMGIVEFGVEYVESLA